MVHILKYIFIQIVFTKHYIPPLAAMGCDQILELSVVCDIPISPSLTLSKLMESPEQSNATTRLDNGISVYSVKIRTTALEKYCVSVYTE